MKRKIERIPEFDEIIFENRNRTYGAYDLRKRYKSVACVSILLGIFVGVSLVATLSFTTKKEIPEIRIPISGPIIIDVPVPEPIIPEIPKAPAGMERMIRNLAPKVTDDPLEVTPDIPTSAELIKIENPGVTDTIVIRPPSDDVIPQGPEEIRVFVEEMPEFPGGASALLRYVGENLNYPESAIENGIQGKVFLKFVVNRDGSVDRIEVIKGVDPLLDQEALRVIGSLPKFRPGRQNGVEVPVWFTIPVVFQLKN